MSSAHSRQLADLTIPLPVNRIGPVDERSISRPHHDRIVRMFESSVDEVAAGDVAGLAAALLGLTARDVLGGDLASAQAVVAATQRVLNAVSAVQVLGIEAWSRRTG